MAKIELSEENIYKGSLLLVTPTFSLAHFPANEEMEPAMGCQPQIQIKRKAAEALQELLKNIHCHDEILPVSGFRTQQEQEQIWNDTVEESGLSFTKKFVAVPGHSEHQTGLAIDLAENKEPVDFICPSFPYTGIYQRFRKHAPCFGFIERYPSGKENITGIGAEPWHFRYVGYPHSVIMTENEMTLEEYIQFLRENTDAKHPYRHHFAGRDIRVFYIGLEGRRQNCGKQQDIEPASSQNYGQQPGRLPKYGRDMLQDSGAPTQNHYKKMTLELSEKYHYHISGTNEGGVVVSLWRK